jgi:hypothetical protein
MCGKDKAPVAPAARPKRNQSDPHSDFVLNTCGYLATKVNPAIQITKKGNTMTMSNISDADLQNLQMLTSTDQSNRPLRFSNIQVSIPDAQGFTMQLNIPGLNEIMGKIVASSATEAFLANQKVHKPFKQLSAKAVAPQSPVSDIVDMLTSMIPSVPKSTGKSKTYKLSLRAGEITSLGDGNTTPAGGCPIGSYITNEGCAPI